MGIFDTFGGTNKFKKGMVAGAKPFADKFEQHAEALKRLEKNFGEQWKITKDIADTILDSIEATERERLYGLYTQIDIKELKSEYKELLLAILFTLSGENSNEFQQSYIRSVQKYLGIKIPQAKIEFAGIENIESLTAQKAILQACMEYLLLAANNASFFDEYAENLFSLFAVKEKGMLEIWENVLQIYLATGPLGLSEKYGFVPVVKPETILSGKQDIFEKYVIEQVLEVLSDQETTIEGKEIILKEDIVCKGKLVLKNCVIYYNGDNIEGQIRLDANSTLALSHCSIIGKNNTKRIAKPEKQLIIGKDKTSKMDVENCLFVNCLSFANQVEASFKSSIIRYTEMTVNTESSLGFITHPGQLKRTSALKHTSDKKQSTNIDFFVTGITHQKWRDAS